MADTALVPRPGLVLPLLVASVGIAAQASALILVGERRVAGALAAVVGIALVAAGRSARRNGAPRLLFADSVAERTADALLLGAVAWVALPQSPWVGGGALVALVASYLASYLRARSVGLGFSLEESTVDRAVLLAALAAGLVLGLEEVGLWSAAAFSFSVTIKRAIEVARQKEPA
ncbi:MAG TPA: hypothetical protein VEA19_07175 [Actinomycetota bacterium]|nr:hypothetical protein [Actinomycetota bacterium]